MTYAYISDAHDNHTIDTAFGPSQAGYMAQLKAYDEASAGVVRPRPVACIYAGRVGRKPV